MEPRAMGTNRMLNFRYRETSRLAAAVARKPSPRIRKERRAPARATKKPALALMTTIKSKPSHGCGDCKGASPRATPTTNAACSESINPARQKAQAAVPASKASPRETSSDFQENLFKTLRGAGCELGGFEMGPAEEARPEISVD